MKKLRDLIRDKDKAYKANNTKNVALICVELAAEFNAAKNLKMAEQELLEALEIYKSLGESKRLDVAQMHRGLCDLYLEMSLEDNASEGVFATALDHAEAYYGIVKALDIKIEIQRALTTFGRCYLDRSHHSETDRKAKDLAYAEKYFHQSLKAVEVIENYSVEMKSEMRGVSIMNMADVAYNQDDFEKAQNRLNDAEKLVSREDRLRLLTKRSSWSLENCDLEAALSASEELMKLSRKCFTGSDEYDSADICESAFINAIVHFNRRDYKITQKLLWLRYKKCKATKALHNCKEKIPDILKAVTKILNLIEKLTNTDIDDAVRSNLHEKVGDHCGNSGYLIPALHHYKLSLEYANQSAVFDVKKKASLLFSVADTAYELKDYNTAKKFFEKELSITEHELGACTTLIRLSNCNAKLSNDFNLRSGYLHTALNLVDKFPRSTSEKIKILDEIIYLEQEMPNSSELKIQELQENLRSTEELAKKEAIDDINLDSSRDEDDPGSGPESDVDIDALEFEDLPESRETMSKARKKYRLTRNQMGETRLQTLCKEPGNLEKIEKLIEAGHPVNVEDNVHLTPLHEAAERGYLDYVKVLVDAGAFLNALTDDKASALSEAAVGGHLSVVEFLLRAGAKVHLQDKDGWTAANHLKRYLSKCRGEFTKEEFEKGRELVTEMFEKYKALQKAGVFVPIARKEESTVFKEDHEDEATSKAQVFHDDDDFFVPDTVDSPKKQKSPNTSIVSNSSSSLLSRRRENNNKDREPLKEKNSLNFAKSSLRRRDDAVDANSDSEDSNDSFGSSRLMQKPFKSKLSGQKKRRLVDDTLNCSRVSDFDNEFIPPRTETVIKRKPPAKKQKKLDYFSFKPSSTSSVMPGSDLNAPPVDSDEEIENPANEQQPPPVVQQPMVIHCNAAAPAPAPLLRHQSSSTIRLKVSVKGNRIIIPSDPNNTIGWLEKETSDRFYDMYNERPKSLSLSVDGCDVHSKDRISDVIDPNNAGSVEITAKVSSWDIKTLEERYVANCQENGRPVLSNIVMKMKNFALTRRLELSGCLFSPEDARPVMRALKDEPDVEAIDLSRNRLGGLKDPDFWDCIPKDIRSLDVSSCGITVSDLISLSKVLNQRPQLVTLHIGFNLFFGKNPAAVTAFRDLINLPNLDTFSAQCCSTILKEFLKREQPNLKAILGRDRIRNLDLSNNDLKDEEENLLLKCVSDLCIVKVRES